MPDVVEVSLENGPGLRPGIVFARLSSARIPKRWFAELALDLARRLAPFPSEQLESLELVLMNRFAYSGWTIENPERLGELLEVRESELEFRVAEISRVADKELPGRREKRAAERQAFTLRQR